MNKKCIMVLFTVVLIISITPITAVKISQNVSDETNINDSISDITNNAKKIEKISISTEEHAKVINESIRYITDNWWKFWCWGEIGNKISIIETETAPMGNSDELSDLTGNIENDSKKIENDAKKIEKKLKTDENDNEEAVKMGQELKHSFNATVRISSANNLENGDIVQLKADKSHTVYLNVLKLTNAANNTTSVILEGTDSKISEIPMATANKSIKYKLTITNSSLNSSKAVDHIFNTQKNQINENINYGNYLSYTVRNGLIIGGSAAVAVSVMLGIMTGIFIGGSILFLIAACIPTMQLFGGLGLMYAMLACMTGGSATALVASSLTLFALAASLHKIGNGLKDSSIDELNDLSRYHNGDGRINAPIAQNSTLKLESGQEKYAEFNATDPNKDKLEPKIISTAKHGNVTIPDAGRFLYKCEKDFIGNDTFSYTVTNSKGIESNVGWVKIKVSPLAPLEYIAENFTYNITENETISQILVPPSSYTVNITQKPLHGSLNIIQPVENPLKIPMITTFTYTPYKGFISNDTFSYQLSLNGRVSNIGWVNLIVSPRITK